MKIRKEKSTPLGAITGASVYRGSPGLLLKASINRELLYKGSTSLLLRFKNDCTSHDTTLIQTLFLVMRHLHAGCFEPGMKNIPNGFPMNCIYSSQGPAPFETSLIEYCGPLHNTRIMARQLPLHEGFASRHMVMPTLISSDSCSRTFYFSYRSGITIRCTDLQLAIACTVQVHASIYT